MNDQPPYFAFISYSRKDSKAAAWLQRRLEWFRFPVKLVAQDRRPPHPRYLRPLYRDKTNLEVDHAHYWENIKLAIEQSRFLLVLCSPDSARSGPVDLEVRHFLETREKQSDRKSAVEAIVPVILRGRVGDGSDEDCLCPALRNLGEDIIHRNLPTMVADEEGSEAEARETGFVGLVSYLLSIHRGELADHLRREERRKAAVTRLVAGAMALLFVLAVAAGVKAWLNEKEAVVQRQIAEQKTRETLLALSRADFEYGTEKIEKGQTVEGAAYLARALRHNPDNQAAAQRLFSLLAHRTHWLPELPPLPVHGGVIEMQYAPDGKRLLVRSIKGGLRLYDAATGRDVSGDFCPPEFSLSSAQYLASGDLILTGQLWAADGNIPGYSFQRWDPVTLKPKSPRYELDTPPLVSPLVTIDEAADLLCLHDNGDNETLSLHRLSDGKSRCPSLHPGGRISRLVIAPNGKALLVFTDKKKLQIFDITTGQPMGEVVEAPENVTFEDFAFVGDTSWLLKTGRNQLGKRLWQLVNAATDEVAGHWVDDQFLIREARLDPAALTMTAQGMDGRVRRISLRGPGEVLAEPVVHRGSTPAAVRPDFHQTATETSLGIVQLRHLAPKLPGGRFFFQTSDSLNAVLSPDGRHLLRSGVDNQVTLHDALTGELIGPSHAHADYVTWLGFANKGTFAVSADIQGTVKVFAMTQLSEPPWELKAEGTLPEVKFAPDGPLLLVKTNAAKVQVWNLPERTKTELPEGFGMLRAFGFLSRTEFFIARGKLVEIWQTAPLQKQREFKATGDLADLSAAALSHDHSLIATATEDVGIRIWSMDDGSAAKPIIGPQGNVKALSFSNSDDFLLVTLANEVRVFEVATGKEAAPALRLQGLKDASFSPQGHLLLTTVGQTARLWDWRTSRPVGDQWPTLFNAKFSADGSQILLGPMNLCQLTVVPPDAPPPEWLGSLVESVYQERLGLEGIPSEVPAQAWLDLKVKLAAQTGEAFWPRFARWFAADPWERTVTPESADKTIDFLTQQITPFLNPPPSAGDSKRE